MFSDLNWCGIMVGSGSGGPWTLSWVGAIRAETSEQTLTDHRVMMIHPDNCQSQAAQPQPAPNTNTTIKLAEEKHGPPPHRCSAWDIFIACGLRCWYLIDWGLELRWRAEAGDRGQGWHWQLQISFHHFVTGVISNITTSRYVIANRENRQSSLRSLLILVCTFSNKTSVTRSLLFESE